MASRRGISAMTLVLFWTEMIEVPIKMQESWTCSTTRSVLPLGVRSSSSEVYPSTPNMSLCQMHLFLLALCWSIWIFKCCFDGQSFLFCHPMQCFLRLSFSSLCCHLISEPETTLQKSHAGGILRRCLKSLHHCPRPTPAMIHRCSLLSIFDVLIHAQLW